MSGEPCNDAKLTPLPVAMPIISVPPPQQHYFHVAIHATEVDFTWKKSVGHHRGRAGGSGRGDAAMPVNHVTPDAAAARWRTVLTSPVAGVKVGGSGQDVLLGRPRIHPNAVCDYRSQR